MLILILSLIILLIGLTVYQIWLIKTDKQPPLIIQKKKEAEKKLRVIHLTEEREAALDLENKDNN